MKPVIDHTDAGLIALLNQGDRKAFETIYRKYVRELLGYARKNISVPEDCEEIVQEVFVSIWARRSSLQISSLRTYLYSMVKYMMIKYFKGKAVRKRYAEHYRIFEALYDNLDEESFDHSVMQAMIDRSLATLPERCQVAVRLRLNENLSNGDIAVRMNVTKKTVENYVVMFVAHFRASFSKPSQVRP